LLVLAGVLPRSKLSKEYATKTHNKAKYNRVHVWGGHPNVRSHKEKCTGLGEIRANRRVIGWMGSSIWGEVGAPTEVG